MDDVLESGGWRTHSTCPVTALQVTAWCWCGVTNHQHHCRPVILFIFLFFSKYPQSLFHFQHMTLSHRCYRPPRPAMAPPARRLRRPSARCSDPTRAGSARRTVPSVKVKDQVNQGQGMMDAVGEVSHRVRKDELRPQSFHDLIAVQRRPSPREDDDRDRVERDVVGQLESF